MRKRLQTILMAGPLVAISLSLPLSAQAGSGADSGTPRIQITTDGAGRTVYTNDDDGNSVTRSSSVSTAIPYGRSRLMFWSVTEHRWKPVPSAKVGAARSAAAEVNRMLNRDGNDGANADSEFLRSDNTFSEKDIDDAIEKAAARHNVDPNLVRSVIKVESNFNPNAVSNKGAMGLMQLMPRTANGLSVSNPFDPQQNVDAGVRHLKQLLNANGGDVRLSLAAYNAGQGAVRRSRGVPHYAETQNYVKRITDLYWNRDGRTFITPRAPVHTYRSEDGVVHMSNTE